MNSRVAFYITTLSGMVGMTALIAQKFNENLIVQPGRLHQLLGDSIDSLIDERQLVCL